MGFFKKIGKPGRLKYQCNGCGKPFRSDRMKLIKHGGSCKSFPATLRELIQGLRVGTKKEEAGVSSSSSTQNSTQASTTPRRRSGSFSLDSSFGSFTSGSSFSGSVYESAPPKLLRQVLLRHPPLHMNYDNIICCFKSTTHAHTPRTHTHTHAHLLRVILFISKLNFSLYNCIIYSKDWSRLACARCLNWSVPICCGV